MRKQLTSPPSADTQAIGIRVRGDGKRYQLRIRTTTRWDGPSYAYEFATQDESWLDLILPLDEFRARFRGRAISGAGPIDPSQIRHIGVLIAGEQWGSFRLELETVRALPGDVL